MKLPGCDVLLWVSSDLIVSAGPAPQPASCDMVGPCPTYSTQSLSLKWSLPGSTAQLTLTGTPVSNIHLCLLLHRCLLDVSSSLGPDVPQWPHLRLYCHDSSSAVEWLRENPRDFLSSFLPPHPGPIWVTANVFSLLFRSRPLKMYD